MLTSLKSMEMLDTNGRNNPHIRVDLNSTYIFPRQPEKEANPSLNVTVSLKNHTGHVQDATNFSMISPLESMKKDSPYIYRTPTAFTRTIVKEHPLKGLQGETDGTIDNSKVNKVPAPPTKPADPNKYKYFKSGISSCPNNHMKSTYILPSLTPNTKKVFGLGTKSGPIYGSAGKLYEAQKPKPLEEAELRKQEIIRQRQENTKRKLEEWNLKTEKAKLEKDKRKQNIIQNKYANSLNKNNMVAVDTMFKSGCGGFVKPKLTLSTPISKLPPFRAPETLPSSTSKPEFFVNPARTVPPIEEMDEIEESFHTAIDWNSFLNCSIDDATSTYNITAYEDLEEDLQYRKYKTVPSWASDGEMLKMYLFSTTLMEDYGNLFAPIFPKRDETIKLFPDKDAPNK